MGKKQLVRKVRERALEILNLTLRDYAPENLTDEERALWAVEAHNFNAWLRHHLHLDQRKEHGHDRRELSDEH